MRLTADIRRIPQHVTHERRQPTSEHSRPRRRRPAGQSVSADAAVDDLEQVAEDDEYLESLDRPPTQYLDDDSQSIVATNDSPDVGFNYSVNPYRGCATAAATATPGRRTSTWG